MTNYVSTDAVGGVSADEKHGVTPPHGVTDAVGGVPPLGRGVADAVDDGTDAVV